MMLMVMVMMMMMKMMKNARKFPDGYEKEGIDLREETFGCVCF